MIKLGIAGYGYWGKNLVREFNKINDVSIHTICDVSDENLVGARNDYAYANLTKNYEDMVNDNNIDAVVIATPIHSHYELALSALKAGKHILVEKPLATRLKEAIDIQEKSTINNTIVMVDYTPVYSSAIQTLHNIMLKKELGNIAYFDSIRTNYGSNDLTSSVIWDLAIHDLALITYLLPAKPIAVSASGRISFDNKTASIAYITLFFADNVIAHIYVNAISPEKLRHITIAGSKKIAVFDDCLIEDKVKIYDIGIEDIADKQKYSLIKGHTQDAAHSLAVGHNDSLAAMVKHFIDCVDHHKVPDTNSQTSIKLIYILESAEKSLKQHGTQILLNQVLL